MNQTKFKYLKGRVESKIKEEIEKEIQQFEKKNPQPKKPASVIKYESEIQKWSTNKYKHQNETRISIRKKWDNLLDKAYLGEDKEIIELLSN